MNPLVYYEKGSSKKYDPFSSHGGYMFYGDCELFKLSPISVLKITPKYIGSYVLITYWFCGLRLVLKIYLA